MRYIGFDHPHGGFRGCGRAHPCSSAREQFRDQGNGIRIVINRQNMDAVEVAGREWRQSRRRARMNAFGLLRHRIRNYEWQLHSECRAPAETSARCLDCAAMHFDQLAGDGKAQAKSAALAGDTGIGLTKSFEYMGQELGRNAYPGVATDTSTCELTRPSWT